MVPTAPRGMTPGMIDVEVEPGLHSPRKNIAIARTDYAL